MGQDSGTSASVRPQGARLGRAGREACCWQGLSERKGGRRVAPPSENYQHQQVRGDGINCTRKTGPSEEEEGFPDVTPPRLRIVVSGVEVRRWGEGWGQRRGRERTSGFLLE